MSQVINDIYRSILAYAGMEADDQGFVSVVAGENKREPAFIDGLRIVLPTNEQLRGFNPKEKIGFHPLTENVLRGESEVIQKLKTVINIRLNVTTGHIVSSLLSLVASPQLHPKLNSQQSELMYKLKEGDEKTAVEFTKQMVAGMKSTPDRFFVNVYLKRGGTYKGKRYARVGVVTFPFYEGLKAGKYEKISAKHRQTLIEIFQFVFPGIDEEDEYNFGSDSHVAPFLEALMMSSANVASRLNDLLNLYNKYIEEADTLVFESDWMEHFQNLPALVSEIRKIPPLSGNEGLSPISQTEEQGVATQVAQPTVQAPAQTVQQVLPPAVVPMYHQTAQVPTPAQPVKVGKKGIDFKDLKAMTPGLAMAPNPLAPPMAMYPGQMPQAMNPMQMVQTPVGMMPMAQAMQQGLQYMPVQPVMNPAMGQPAMVQPGMPQQMQAPQMVQTPFGPMSPMQPVSTVGGIMPLGMALQQGLAYQPAQQQAYPQGFGFR